LAEVKNDNIISDCMFESSSHILCSSGVHDARKKLVAEVRKSGRKSWKSYTCFSADYLREKKKLLWHSQITSWYGTDISARC